MIRQLKNRKLTPEIVRFCRSKRAAGYPIKALSLFARLSPGPMSRMLNRKTYKEIA